jgi:hypothetical protein
MDRDAAEPRYGVRLLAFSEAAVAALADAREEIDALNVYPVPDGDTGTNLFLTFEFAHSALLKLGEADPMRMAEEYSRGLLLGARGNSGVIASQLLGAFFKRLFAGVAASEPLEVSIAEAMGAASEAGYAAVGAPVEGTILTVAREAAEAATAVSRRPDASVFRVVRTASKAAQEALARTTDQLEALRRAGVVDAGGRGLCVVLEAAELSLTGRRPLSRPRSRKSLALPTPVDELTPQGPAYEVMYLLDADGAQIPELRGRLQDLGDSLVVVGDDAVWNVHVHVNDVGAAIEAGMAAGRPHRIRVTHFAEQAAHSLLGHGLEEPPSAAVEGPTRPGRSVVAVAYGEGLAGIFAEAGAVVVTQELAGRPSTMEILEAIRRSATHEVIVLSNDRDVLPTAEAAARTATEDHGIRVSVVPTNAQVQGLAALAVHDPGRTIEHDLVEMTAAARHARSGAVTVAVKQAITSGGPVEAGDVLGAVEGDFVIVGDDLYGVAVEVLERMLGGGGELVTLVAGKDGEDLASRCAKYLSETHPSIDVVTYLGRQDRYPVLFGVE